MVIDFTASIVTAKGLRTRIEALRAFYNPVCGSYFDDILSRRGSAFGDSASGFLLLDSLLQKNGINRMEAPIVINERRRPHIDRDDMDFSVSHSEGCAICVLAVGEGANVGCDVQRARNYTNDKMNVLAKTFMTERELTVFGNSADKTSDFFTAWTRREAFVKRVESDIFDNLRTADLKSEHFREGVITACGNRYFYSINLPAEAVEIEQPILQTCNFEENK